MLTAANLSKSGQSCISELPQPLPYGRTQSCLVTLAWPNKVVYLAMVSLDMAGNTAMLSNIVTVYVAREVTTPAPDITHPLLLMKILRANNSIETILSELDGGAGEGGGLYIAGCVMSGVVTVIVLLLIAMIINNKKKEGRDQATPNFPVSEIRVRETKSESPTIVHGSKLSLDGSSKVLLSWLEALPTKEENLIIKDSQDSDNPLNQMNTPTRSPQRQRMLTNGSFKPVREATSGSDCGSGQLTTSTLDESHSSDSSQEFYTSYSTHTGGVRRSNTSATLARGSSSTGYFSVKEYGLEYGAATLGRVPRGRQGVGARRYREGAFMPVVSETDLYHSSRTGRRLKRTESFV